ncbi:MAG: alpha-hydroxy-acid oxidizing protein [Planctomycetaceae bacterium]
MNGKTATAGTSTQCRDVLQKHLQDIGFKVNGSLTDEELWAFNLQAWDMAMTWDVFAWIRSFLTDLPLVIKGVLRPDDGRKAVELGIEGIIVSNHGGRKLDGMPSTIRMLPGVVEAVGARRRCSWTAGSAADGRAEALALAAGVLIGRGAGVGAGSRWRAGRAACWSYCVRRRRMRWRRVDVRLANDVERELLV